MKRFMKILIASSLCIPLLSPTTAFAIDKNAVEKNGKENEKNSTETIKEYNEAAKKNQSNHGMDIESEAYASFDSIKANFSTMQSQYGNLSETNMSTGYKTYLSQVQNDNDNMALNYKLIAQKSGKYSISENGLVLSQTRADALADSMFANDTSKKAMLEQSDEMNDDNESTQNTSLSGDITISGNAFGSNYQESANSNEDLGKSALSDVEGQMQKAQDSNQALLESSVWNTDNSGSDSQKTNDAIANNYENLKKTIEASQKTVKNDGIKAANTKFTAKVAGWDAARKASTK